MPTGEIVYYDTDDGYGFIETEVTADNVFFHVSDIDDVETVSEGDELSFEIRNTDKGPRAQRISVV